MRSIRPNLLKVLFVIALLCPAVFADGDMGSGGLADSDKASTTTKTTRSLEDGDMGSGGRSAGDSESRTYLDSVFGSIYEYLNSVI